LREHGFRCNAECQPREPQLAIVDQDRALGIELVELGCDVTRVFGEPVRREIVDTPCTTRGSSANRRASANSASCVNVPSAGERRAASTSAGSARRKTEAMRA